MMNRETVKSLLLVGTFSVVTGCAGQKFELQRIESGDVLTSGLVIRAEDNSFQYTQGQPFPTPWTANDCPIEPTTSNWMIALRAGAKRVIVHHPASTRPLHGLLAFCPSPPSSAPSGRSHGIQVPDNYVTSTAGGLTTVVFDGVEYNYQYRSDAGGVRSATFWPTWILWLKERPF